MKLNLNEKVKFKLTDLGKAIYYHQYDEINNCNECMLPLIEPEMPEVDENGYTEMQLWCFIELYGKHMGMGKPNVIEPLEIIFETELENGIKRLLSP